jgi:tRNA dimethylallyltransferase
LQKLIVIIGPTASGKSDLAVKIAKEFNGEIISADSRQVYRGMDIGTAKPGKKELAAIKHYLIDIRDPDQDYSAGRYKKDAIRAIDKTIKVGKIPILIGGTGLYIDAVVKNLEFPKVKENKKLRARLEREIREKGLDFVFKKLVDLDPEAAYIVDPQNPRRVVRALEVALISGKPFSAQRRTGRPLYDALEIGINVPPKVLKEKIAKRIEQMVKNGLVDEAEDLVRKHGPNCKVLDAIGYREITDYLKGEISLAEAMEQMKKNTWHYAKRQMTWFKKDKSIKWISDPREAEPLILEFLNKKAA